MIAIDIHTLSYITPDGNVWCIQINGSKREVECHARNLGLQYDGHVIATIHNPEDYDGHSND